MVFYKFQLAIVKYTQTYTLFKNGRKLFFLKTKRFNTTENKFVKVLYLLYFSIKQNLNFQLIKQVIYRIFNQEFMATFIIIHVKEELNILIKVQKEQ